MRVGIAVWLLSVVVVVSLAGCGKKQVVQEPPDAGVLEPGEIARTESLEWTDATESTDLPPVDVLEMEEAEFIPPVRGPEYGDKTRSGGLETVYFDFDESNITPDQAARLDRNAAHLLEHPQVVVELQGHCDERGTEEYNLALGDRRALAVRTYLAKTGVEPGRLITVSYGETMPAVGEDTMEAYALNRRVEFWELR